LTRGYAARAKQISALGEARFSDQGTKIDPNLSIITAG